MNTPEELVQQMRAAAEAGSPSLVEAVRQKPATVFALIAALEAMTRERDIANSAREAHHQSMAALIEETSAALEAANARADAAEAKVEAVAQLAEAEAVRCQRFANAATTSASGDQWIAARNTASLLAREIRAALASEASS